MFEEVLFQISVFFLLSGEYRLVFYQVVAGNSESARFMGRASEAIETYHHVITLLESTWGDGDNEESVVPLLALGNLLIKE